MLVLSYFITDLPTDVMYLRGEKEIYDVSERRDVFTQFKFVAMMTTQLDIDLALKSFLVAMQSDSLLVIN